MQTAAHYYTWLNWDVGQLEIFRHHFQANPDSPLIAIPKLRTVYVKSPGLILITSEDVLPWW